MKDALEHLKKWQGIYGVIIAIAVSFIMYGVRIDNLENRVKKIEIIQDSNQVLLVQIQKDIVEVKTSLEFIRQAIR